MLETDYLGMRLTNPIIASASPYSRNLAGVQRLARAGVGAIVLESLFEEQVDLESQLVTHLLSGVADSYAEALSYFPDRERYRQRPEQYCLLIGQARESVHVPIIASLNGVTPGGWLDYARSFEDAGASAIELNLYNLATDPECPASQLEDQYVEVVRQVAHSVRLPVAVKISPFFTSLPHLARRFARAGAKGLVLFNRFYQPDIDLDQLDVKPRLELSRPYDLLLPLTWTAILHGRVSLDLSITGGVHDHQGILKAMMAGAQVVEMASRFLHDGPEVVGAILHDLRHWMQEHDYESLEQMQGSMSQRSVADPAAYERANYMKTLHSFRTP